MFDTALVKYKVKYRGSRPPELAGGYMEQRKERRKNHRERKSRAKLAEMKKRLRSVHDESDNPLPYQGSLPR